MTTTHRKAPQQRQKRDDGKKWAATNVGFNGFESEVLEKIIAANQMPSRAAMLRALVIREGERLGFVAKTAPAEEKSDGQQSRVSDR